MRRLYDLTGSFPRRRNSAPRGGTQFFVPPDHCCIPCTPENFCKSHPLTAPAATATFAPRFISSCHDPAATTLVMRIEGRMSDVRHRRRVQVLLALLRRVRQKL